MTDEQINIAIAEALRAESEHELAEAASENEKMREALEDIARHASDCVKRERTDHPLLGDVAALGSIARGALKEETK